MITHAAYLNQIYDIKVIPIIVDWGFTGHSITYQE